MNRLVNEKGNEDLYISNDGNDIYVNKSISAGRTRNLLLLGGSITN